MLGIADVHHPEVFMSRQKCCTPAALAVSALLLLLAFPAAAQETAPSRTGREVYEAVCITCHGPDGRGGVNPALEKIVKPPDFADCAFAAREPDRGFLAVAHNGGPARGFSPLMAPWGGTYTEAELAARGLAPSHVLHRSAVAPRRAEPAAPAGDGQGVS